MKKFLKNLLACFIILLIFSGTVFFMGWTQIRIKPDCIGVLKSKTGGVMKSPIYPGKFSWHWEFLLPTNAELKIFELKPYSFSKKISGSLPSGEVYGEVLSSNVDFSYSFDFDFSISVSAQSVVNLFSSRVISGQEGLERHLEQECDSAAKALASEIMKKIEKDPQFKPETLTFEDLKKLVNLEERYSGLQFNSVVLKKALYPDYSLYEKARSVYLKQLESPVKTKEGPAFKQPEEEKTEAASETSAQEEDAAFFKKLKKLMEKQD